MFCLFRIIIKSFTLFIPNAEVHSCTISALILTPTIEMATKIADALKVSLDYLTGLSELEFDRDVLTKIQEVSKMNSNDK